MENKSYSNVSTKLCCVSNHTTLKQTGMLLCSAIAALPPAYWRVWCCRVWRPSPDRLKNSSFRHPHVSDDNRCVTLRKKPWQIIAENTSRTSPKISEKVLFLSGTFILHQKFWVDPSSHGTQNNKRVALGDRRLHGGLPQVPSDGTPEPFPGVLVGRTPLLRKPGDEQRSDRCQLAVDEKNHKLQQLLLHTKNIPKTVIYELRCIIKSSSFQNLMALMTLSDMDF